jgi:predicted transcriptional regulator
MAKEDILELENRKKIYNHILKSPGLHEREIAREIGMPLSTLNYHLNYLTKRELVMAKPEGHYTRYYVVRKVGIKDKKVISLLRQSLPRRIIMFLLLHPNSSHQDICKHLQVAPSTTSFHLNKLIDAGIIERLSKSGRNRYAIREAEDIADLLIIYKNSFFDSAVDRFVDAWMEFSPKHLRKRE